MTTNVTERNKTLQEIADGMFNTLQQMVNRCQDMLFSPLECQRDELVAMDMHNEERNDHTMITGNTGKWNVSRVLVIEYDGDGRYHEHLFSRTVPDNAPDNASPVYIDPVGRKFNESLLKCRSKVCPIPDNATLCRWVLGDGTVVTTTHEFPQSDFVHLRTFDERYMFVPMSNIAYVLEDAK